MSVSRRRFIRVLGIGGAVCGTIAAAGYAAVSVDGALFLVMAFELAPDGIRGIRNMLNPRKLDHLRGSVDPTR